LCRSGQRQHHPALDFGLPLSFEFGDDISSVLPEPLYSNVVNGNKKIDALCCPMPIWTIMA